MRTCSAMKLACLSLAIALVSAGAGADSTVRMNADEAEIVLSILDRVADGRAPRDDEWARLFASEPYVRLKRREAGMKRDFTDDEFRRFVLSPELVAKRAELRATLDAWRSVDLASPVATAVAYLPEGADIRGTIYPVIKPITNSFVFEVDTDPAIFLYLDPEVAPGKLANTLAHELHHIGFGRHCPTAAVEREIDGMPDNESWVVRRLGAFGEGFAMLAAAGGLEKHPHEESVAEERARWDADVARVGEDMRAVSSFLEGSLDGTLPEEEKNAQFRSFYGIQGPWYTVGWVMAATIERELGRDALISAFCDTRTLLATYNAAATLHNAHGGSALPLWPEKLVARVRGGSAV